MMLKYLTITISISLASYSFSAPYDASLGRDAAEYVLHQLDKNPNASKDFDLNETVKAFKQVLSNSMFIKDQKMNIEVLNAEAESRRQAEVYYLKNVATLPLYQRSSTGYLYVPLVAPDNPNSPKPSSTDLATFSIKATTHEGISLMNTKGKYITKKIDTLPKGIAWSIMSMRTGEEREMVLPSWTMFGGTQYINIPPYSTIIADISLKNFKSPKVKKKPNTILLKKVDNSQPHAASQSLEKSHQ